MTAFRPRVIKSAIAEVLEGTTGAIRRVPPGTFKRGTFEGQPNTAQKAAAIDPSYSHRFDVKIGSLKTHASTPLANGGPSRTAYAPITIDITTRLRSTPQDEEREAQRAQIESNANAALVALMYPNNLLFDGNTTPTGIVSGILVGPNGDGHPDWEEVEEAWDKQLHRSRINAAAIVVIDQTVT